MCSSRRCTTSEASPYLGRRQRRQHCLHLAQPVQVDSHLHLLRRAGHALHERLVPLVLLCAGQGRVWRGQGGFEAGAAARQQGGSLAAACRHSICTHSTRVVHPLRPHSTRAAAIAARGEGAQGMPPGHPPSSPSSSSSAALSRAVCAASFAARFFAFSAYFLSRRTDVWKLQQGRGAHRCGWGAVGEGWHARRRGGAARQHPVPTLTDLQTLWAAPPGRAAQPALTLDWAHWALPPLGRVPPSRLLLLRLRGGAPLAQRSGRPAGWHPRCCEKGAEGSSRVAGLAAGGESSGAGGGRRAAGRHSLGRCPAGQRSRDRPPWHALPPVQRPAACSSGCGPAGEERGLGPSQRSQVAPKTDQKRPGAAAECIGADSK